MIVETGSIIMRELGVEGIDRIEVIDGRVFPYQYGMEKLIEDYWTTGEVDNLIEALEKVREVLGSSPARPQPVSKAEMELRRAAADWQETPIGAAYGQTVLEILDRNA